MGALVKTQPGPYIVEIETAGSQQIIRLPSDLRIEANKLILTRSAGGLSLVPVPTPPTEQEFEQWKQDMQAFQDELGDLFPEGRHQPPMPEPRDIFPDDDDEPALK